MHTPQLNIHTEKYDADGVFTMSDRETRRRVEQIDYKDFRDTTPVGKFGLWNERWRMKGRSEYIDNQPVSGQIYVTNTGENTASAVQEALGFFKAEFGEPLPETPPHQ